MKRIFYLFLIIFYLLGLITGEEFDLHLSDRILFEGYSKLEMHSMNASSGDIIKTESDMVRVSVISDSQFNYDVGEYHKLTNDEVKRIKDERKQLAEAYHKSLNLKIYKELSLMSLSNLYVSKYFPIVSFEIDSQKLVDTDYSILNKLANISNVNQVVVSPKYEVKAQAYSCRGYEVMNARDEIDNGTLTGRGVVAGVIDIGILDRDNPNFEGKNVIVRNHPTFIEMEDSHATYMGALIGGTYGVARNATILSVQEFLNLTGEFDWLIDNNVDVVNMSIGDNPNGLYKQTSATVDYMIRNYGITCCTSAGNYTVANGYYICNPGMAYNSITVGNGTYDYYMDSGSCYMEQVDVSKPTITNYGSYAYLPDIDGSMSGTSLACALTTGAVALLMEEDPTLKLYPARVTALLTACSYMMPNYDYYDDSYLDDKVGSGYVDFGRAKENITNYVDIPTNSSHTNGSEIYVGRFYIAEGQKIRISLCWLAHSTGTVNSLKCNDYDLSLCRPAGQQVDTTWGSTGTVDMINYTAEYTGNYWIRVYVTNNNIDTSSQQLFFCWSIED